jgi:hypothetical protein
MPIIRKRATYILITEDFDPISQIRDVLETRTGVWWKLIIKYFDDEHEEPYKVVSESSSDYNIDR